MTTQTMRSMRCYASLFLIALLAFPCAAKQPVDRVVQSADKFLATLSEMQRGKVIFDFHDEVRRAKWSNFPTGFVPRNGIRLRDRTSAQKSATLDLMKVVLSPMGYQKISEIRMADDDFKTNGSKPGAPANHQREGTGFL